MVNVWNVLTIDKHAFFCAVETFRFIYVDPTIWNLSSIPLHRPPFTIRKTKEKKRPKRKEANQKNQVKKSLMVIFLTLIWIGLISFRFK